MSLNIVLASSSASRQTLLKRIISNFVSVSPDLDETPIKNETAKALAKRLSQQKAMTIGKQYLNSLVIAGDQTAECEGVLLHKPMSINKAKEQLTFCSGKHVRFYSGLCTYNTQTENQQITIEVIDVYFRNLSQQEITTYINKEQAIYSVGSFKCEGLGISLFRSISGGDNSVLMGLPLIPLTDFLINEGLNPLLS